MKELAVIIPAYNEEKNIVTTLKKVRDKLRKARISNQIIVVNDGSSDSTKKICDDLKFKYDFHFISYKKNVGYSYAIKRGLDAIRSKYFTIFDMDLQYNPEDIVKMTLKIKNTGADMVYGVIKRNHLSIFQKVRSSFFISLVNFILNTNFVEINSLKICRYNPISKVKLKSVKWGIDAEILYYFYNRKAKIEYQDIEVKRRKYGVSKVNFFNSIISLWEIILLKK